MTVLGLTLVPIPVLELVYEEAREPLHKVVLELELLQGQFQRLQKVFERGSEPLETVTLVLKSVRPLRAESSLELRNWRVI